MSRKRTASQPATVKNVSVAVPVAPLGFTVPGLPLAQLMEQTSRHMHALGHSEGLVPAQWAALRYFHHTLPPGNTAISLARYQGLAFGPVSRTIRMLIVKGLLCKAGSAGPGRSEAVELTSIGRRMLVHDPLNLIAEVLSNLPHGERATLAGAFEAVIRAISSRARPE